MVLQGASTASTVAASNEEALSRAKDDCKRAKAGLPPRSAEDVFTPPDRIRRRETINVDGSGSSKPKQSQVKPSARITKPSKKALAKSKACKTKESENPSQPSATQPQRTDSQKEAAAAASSEGLPPKVEDPTPPTVRYNKQVAQASKNNLSRLNTSEQLVSPISTPTTQADDDTATDHSKQQLQQKKDDNTKKSDLNTEPPASDSQQIEEENQGGGKKKKREKTAEQKAHHARFMRFSRSLASPLAEVRLQHMNGCCHCHRSIFACLFSTLFVSYERAAYATIIL